MFWFCLSILTATAIELRVHAEAARAAAVVAGQDDPPFDRGRSADDRTALNYIVRQLNEIMAATSTGRTADVAPRRSQSSGGLFGQRRRPHAVEKEPAARRRVTQRPKDNAKNATTGDHYADDSGNYSSTAGAPPRTLFDTEEECVSADSGRACACYMTDFLDLLVQRLDEAVLSAADAQGGRDETAALSCRSFKPVPAAFFVYPATATDAAAVPADAVVERNRGKTVGRRGGRGRGGRRGRVRSGGDAVENAAEAAPAWKLIDFQEVVDYRLQNSSTDDHYEVQYSLVGSDAKVQCVINGNGTKMNSFKWDFKQGKHKTNSTVTGTDTNILLILGMEPGDSKNYTCIPTIDDGRKNGSSYKHYVLAVEKAIYEIRGSGVYKTRGGGGCTPELTVLVQKQLPSSMRTVLCPEGSSQYACNVIVEKPKCAEDQRTMEVQYLITLNDKANYLARIRTNKKGRIALRYQQLLAKISSVLASNLNKTMTVPIMSKLSLIDTNFEPDYRQMNTKNFVSCTPGFGIREVLCAACPPHHFSPDKSFECLKCAKGFYQPIAGSEKCVKCRSIFSSGCQMNEVSPIVFYVIGLIILLLCSIFAISCWFCGREENGNSIKMMPKKIRKRFKKNKKYSLVSSTQMEDTADSSSIISKFKNQFKKKSKSKIIDPKIKFNNVHEKLNQQIQNNYITEEYSTTN